jgi:hypothetical protein
MIVRWCFCVLKNLSMVWAGGVSIPCLSDAGPPADATARCSHPVGQGIYPSVRKASPGLPLTGATCGETLASFWCVLGNGQR